MKTVYLCAPNKLGDLILKLIKRIEAQGFKVLSPFIHTNQHATNEEIFKRNIEMIKNADIFVVVLKEYGKDLTAEVGMAYAWGKPMVGIDYNADKNDVMAYYAFSEIIKPVALEKTLEKYK
ncbi:nucleoside 2-deoxyribosyltransferase [Candidatus Daviesbacteria bacterium]|nr:nucleoside 2-deoxyribosyltransferase [Candidatus Daviesbacteria bacterium]